MAYMNSSLNPSPTIVGKAGAALTNAQMLAVACDADGNFVLPAAGALTMGITLSELNDNVAVGQDVTVVVKDITLWKAGAAVKRGQELTADATGRAKPAAEGDYVLAVALDTSGADDYTLVQIVKSGYKA